MSYKSEEQIIVCKKYNAPYVEAPSNLKVGISRNVKEGGWPVNGLRHPIDGDTTGWYIWAGEAYSDDPDFFVPLHVEHLKEWRPEILKYLGLAPGWRFLIGENEYEDVWEDPSLVSDYKFRDE
jgi:hypothetical protein